MRLRPNRTLSAAVLAALMILAAGCAGGLSPGGDSGAETTTTDELETTENETTASETSETDSNATDSDSNATDSNGTDAAMSGKMLFVVNGSDTHLDNASASGNATFRVNASEHTWQTGNESVTITEALSAVGINASADSLTYENKTFNGTSNDTAVSYRVDGTPIDDPSSYELEAGDELHVIANEGNVSTPGRYFNDDHPHSHGTLNVTVNGESVDFSKKRFEMANENFHFHGDENGERWHAHTMNLTASYAVSSLPGINVTSDAVTYNGTTYQRSDADTTVNVTVNGEPVDPETYVLKDGDDIRVTVNETA